MTTSRYILSNKGRGMRTLERLLEGEPVMLEMKNSFVTSFLGRNPILTITPLSVYSSDLENGNDLLFAYERIGCALVPIVNGLIRTLDVMRCGMTPQEADSIATEINSLLRERK